jgi:hypothetical protein
MQRWHNWFYDAMHHPSLYLSGVIHRPISWCKVEMYPEKSLRTAAKPIAPLD